MPAPAIGVRRRFAPPPTARVDWSHPLAPGCGWIPSQGLRTIHGDPVVPLDSLLPLQVATGYGLAHRNGDGSGGRRIVGWPNRLTHTGYLSIMFLGRDEWTRGDAGVIFTRGAGLNPLGMHYDSAGAGYASTAYRGTWDSVGWEQATSGVASSRTDHQTVVAWHAAGATWYRNGAFASTVVQAYSPLNFASLSGADAWCTFDNLSASSRFCDGDYVAALIWPRTLSATEVAALWADPFCFLRR